MGNNLLVIIFGQRKHRWDLGKDDIEFRVILLTRLRLFVYYEGDRGDGKLGEKMGGFPGTGLKTRFISL